MGVQKQDGDTTGDNMQAIEYFAVIIPDRNDRPEFTKHCLRQIDRMTVKPNKVYHINWTPMDNKFDLVERVFDGVERAKADGIDLVFIVENDDGYPADYFKNHLPLNGDIFGDEKTTYYHLKSRTYKHIDHPGRASLFTTGFRISAFEGFQWSGDQFLDLRLWSWAARKGLEMKFARTGAIGIKHGVGKCGGKGHKMKFPTNDPTMSWLRYRVDNESYEFYRNLSQTL